ncbi:nucleotidyltransferase family protein [Paracraurococcus lichenis]|uniref:Nucleotidyltransferase domain-containing protein n=1 Tax=Paracraurococcus lichenis TaxID=3064888 RepID=A0ABT9E5I6_9PROT|nr:nucleotidyltransferase domain-containing protein [Paracraurococcus sp. LOR1-02]MDO9711441.1 nucleotidyltransferase domain-containing protein [Paracraurococcus sp. LOR1-02]
MPHRLSPAEDRLLQSFVAHLTAQAPAGAVRAVRVFGSRARGGSDEQSDLDVAIELREGADRDALHRLVADLAWEAMEERDAHDLALAPVVLPPGPRTGLRDAVARDGIEIWRAPW